MKYQFCIRFNEIDVNSSATKAVEDCNQIFSANGYQDFTLVVPHNNNRKAYYFKLLKEIFNFFFKVKKGAIVGIQYPLLSINEVFKYFIKVARIKKVKFFCIVHDIESLRTGGTDQRKISREVANLNYYDLIIVHNDEMKNWLVRAGVSVPMVTLILFDYLTPLKSTAIHNSDIVYAGNLAKSTFIYALPVLTSCSFKLFGPGCDSAKLKNGVSWGGVFSPEEIVEKMEGSFGLIWDGTEVDRCDDVLGNYLNYNNPHKASLYLAAGLPLIAPKGSAIGRFILESGTGMVVNSLNDLQQVQISEFDYERFIANVAKIQQHITHGFYFNSAIKEAEQILLSK